VFGSLTTLWTLAFDPPSWTAMLPQKFSAATTLINPVGEPTLEVPHAPANDNMTASTAVPPAALTISARVLHN
jgi:hypothetical protein